MVLAELLELLVAGAVGYLSDRVGRKRIMVQGVLLAGVGAVMAPSSAVVAGLFGGGHRRSMDGEANWLSPEGRPGRP
jgi:MFS family permease